MKIEIVHEYMSLCDKRHIVMDSNKQHFDADPISSKAKIKLTEREEYLERLVEERTKELIEERDKLYKIQIDRDKLIKSLFEASTNIEALQGLAGHSRDAVLFVRPGDGHILDANVAATKFYGYEHEELLTMTIYDLRTPEVRKLTAEQMARADTRGILFETVHRRKDGSALPVEVNSRGATIFGTRGLVSVIRDITERRQAEEEREKLISELQDALAKVKLLSGFLPICASCKKIRNDKGYWEQIEAYIRDHSEAQFSHSVCPDRAKKMYPELFGKIYPESSDK